MTDRTCSNLYDELLNGGKDLAALEDLWRSKRYNELLKGEYFDWLSKVGEWTTFITLTFKDEKYPDIADQTFRKLIRVLNTDVFGRHYTRIVGHSYFNYVVGMEYTLSREVCHFHVLVDRPVNFELIHRWWGSNAGFAWIAKVDDREAALRYVVKYVTKSGYMDNVRVFLNNKRKMPRLLPSWWGE